MLFPGEWINLAVMRHKALDVAAAHGDAMDVPDRLNVVILYDKADAGRRAMNQLRKTTDSLVDGLALKVRLWRLDVVADPSVEKSAAADLAAADLLVLAVDKGETLTAATCDRMKEAVRQMNGPKAAVAMLANDNSAASARFDFLQHAAEESGVAFLFPPAVGLPAGRGLNLSAVGPPGPAMTPPPDETLNDAHVRSRWGTPS